MRRAAAFVPCELGTLEGVERLWIRYIVRVRAKGGKFPAAAFGYQATEFGILMICEIQKRRSRGPFFTLKQHRNERRTQDQGSGDLEPSQTQQMTAPFSFGAVANLIVILQVAKKRVPENPVGRSSMSPFAKRRITAVIDEYPLDCFAQISHRAEIGIVAVALAGEHSMQSMMEVIAPLGVDTVTADLLRADNSRIIEIALGDQN